MTARTPMSRCELLDELEAAIVRQRTVTITLHAGGQTCGRPIDLFARDRKDRVTFDDGAEITVDDIARVERVAPGSG